MRFSTFLLLCLSLASPLALGAATIQVNSFVNASVDDGNFTLSEAISAALFDSAQDACAAGSGADEIVLLDAGTYPATNAPFISGGQPLTIRGDRAAGGRSSFVVDLGFLDRFLTVQNGADVTIENLTIRRGEPHFEFGGCLVARESSLTLRDVVLEACVAPTGGALFFRGSGTGHLVVERTTFTGNAARFVPGAGGQRLGGAVALDLNGSSTALFRDVEFTDNQADCLGADCGSAFGGALHAFQFESSGLTLTRVVFTGNRLRFDAGESGTGGAVYLQTGVGPVVVEDCLFTGNGIEGSGAFFGASAFQADLGGPSRLDRLSFVGNDPGLPGRLHVDVRATVDAVVELTNVLIARGPEKGLHLDSQGNGDLTAGNLTVTGHSARGLQAFVPSATATLRLDNSIVWGNGVDSIETFATPATIDPSNFIGIDPVFVNAAADDYELGFTSPARDNGNGSLASVRRYDALHRVRIVGPTIDRGALERNALWSDDFESGDAGAWTFAVP